MAHIMDEKDEDELLATFETLLELYVRSNDSNGFAPAQEVNNANGLMESFRQDEGELEWGTNVKGKTPLARMTVILNHVLAGFSGPCVRAK